MSGRVRVRADADGSLVAAKRIDDPAQAAAEAALLEAARHPGVVDLLDAVGAEAAAGPAEVCTRWVPGRSLELARPTTVPEIAGLLAALADTVADLHQLGITHGRLDASHVLRATNGRPVLCGFSAARRATSPADPEHQRRCGADVAAIGQLALHLLGDTDGDAPTSRHPRWWARPRDQRRLRAVARRAGAPDADRRPSARALAEAILQAVPGADLAPPPTGGEQIGGGPPPGPTHPRGERAGWAGSAQAAADAPEREARVAPASRPVGVTSTALDDLAALDRLRPAEDEPASGPRGRATPRATHRRRAAGVVAASLVLAVIGDRVATNPRATPSDAAAIPADANAAAERAQPTAPGSTRQDGEVVSPTTSSSGGPTHTSAVESGESGDRGVPAGPDPSTTGREGCAGSALEPASLAADVDGDGCLERFSIDGNVIADGVHRWRVGREGDRVALADWDCDGTATPALLRTRTGELFVFPGWARRGEPLEVTPITTVTGAALVSAGPGTPCPTLVVTRADGSTQAVPVPRLEEPRPEEPRPENPASPKHATRRDARRPATPSGRAATAHRPHDTGRDPDPQHRRTPAPKKRRRR